MLAGMLSRMGSYDDGRVACTDDGIIIRHYYLRGDRYIGYGAIREIRQVPLGTGSKWRIHGSGDLVHWFNYDPGRPHKDTALVIYLDGKIRPVITPDDPGRFAAELAEHGLNTTSGEWDSTSQRPLLIFLAGTCLLLAAALIDIRRRPASQIRGSKRMWIMLASLNWLLGPVSYFVFGRRRRPRPREN
jgi:hypothetical protein